MRPVLIFLLLTTAHSAQAQFNSDHEDVKRRKIETATAVKIYGNGDTALHRYTYDEQGHLREWYHAEGASTYFSGFDERGNVVRELEIIPSDTDSHPPVRTDTTLYKITRYDPVTQQIVYQLNVKYENGSRREISVQHNDTLLYYVYHDRIPVLDGIVITAPFDSLPGAKAEYVYSIRYHDSTYSTLRCDTVYELRHVTVFDRRGHKTAFYYGEAGEQLTLLVTYENEYRRDGTLKQQTEHNQKQDGQRPVTHLVSRKSPLSSLADINSRGNVMYTYYK